MKATKLILTIAFFAFSTMVFTQVENFDVNESTSQEITKILYKDAIQNSNLTKAMYVQLNRRSLFFEGGLIYSAKVEYKDNIYVIMGTLPEWKSFFKPTIGLDRYI